MSEEILHAIIQLFAIIVKQKNGVSDDIQAKVRNFLHSLVPESLIEVYFEKFIEYCQSNHFSNNFINPSDSKGQENIKVNKRKAYIEKLKKIDSDRKIESSLSGQSNLVSVTDSVTTLYISKQINRTLTQKQKFIVLLRVLELMRSDQFIWRNRLDVVETVSLAFNIDRFDFDELKSYIDNKEEDLISQNVLVINKEKKSILKHHSCEHLDGNMIVLRIPSCDLFFLRYEGNDELIINSLPASKKYVHVLSLGSSIRTNKSHTIYYSDINAKLLNLLPSDELSFEVKKLTYNFFGGKVAIDDVNFSIDQGKMVGIIGASGSGKTTLINLLAGIEKPDGGSVILNGINVHGKKSIPDGFIGMIPQDDLLIEELTVFENLLYAVKLYTGDSVQSDIDEVVDDTLRKIGLYEARDLVVGNAINNSISGGQRKRLNIALELMREPKVLFVDEPTSGLSSRDSEKVIDILRELSLKGKLVFTVIHQPSSSVFKVFDKILLLDNGGVPIYFGNPLDALQFFKEFDNNIQHEIRECVSCGSVDPEMLFKIVESKVVNEYGEYTDERKVSPHEWKKRFESIVAETTVKKVETNVNSQNLRPSWWNQFVTFSTREIKSKIANRQYLLVNLIEAPLLAFILANLVKFYKDFGNDYSYGDNINIPAYLFMCTIVAIFMGLSVSAEEIVKDRKILKRERFLNLNKLSYLLSKLFVLFLISAIQTFLFVLVGNYILEIRNMLIPIWFALFSAACFSNILGLNISASFNSAVTVYILIPLLLIPQMVLSGAMFSFDRLNKYIGSIDEVPIVADMMVSRWCFEALTVKQFRDNYFERYFYELEKLESKADYNQVYRIPYLKGKLEESLILLELDHYKKGDLVDSLEHRMGHLNSNEIKDLNGNLTLLKNELSKDILDGQLAINHTLSILPEVVPSTFSELFKAIDSLGIYYKASFNKANIALDGLVYSMQKSSEDALKYGAMKKRYMNTKLSGMLKRRNTTVPLIEESGFLIQRIDPIYREPMKGVFRTHFFSPFKYFDTFKIDTYYFDIAIIWMLSGVFFIFLYFDFFPIIVRKIMKLGQSISSIRL